MARVYPHLSDTSFPELNNVDVYKYKNDFNYTRWVPGTKIKLCRVNWCDDYNHVVKFENDAARDAYFDNLAGDTIQLETAVNALPGVAINLPVPFGVLSKYNYLVIDFPIMTSKENKVSFESENRKGRWFYFLNDITCLAPNTTECNISVDWWTTFINDTSLEYVMLERGHAPLATTNAREYLNNPLENNSYLLAPDVNFGEIGRVAASDSHVFNDTDMLACIATSGDPYGDWSGYNTPAAYMSQVQGTPGAYVFAMETKDLHTFFTNVEKTRPQFMQTIKAVFFVSRKLITIRKNIRVCNVPCYDITAVQTKAAEMDLTPELFGYPEQYTNLAKLYTEPYAHLELFDETGAKTIIKIEDTSGSVELNACYSLLFPYLALDAFVTGVGSSKTQTVKFRTLSSHDFKYSGMWADTLRRWDIPTFEVYQSAAFENEYATHYSRAQQALANKTTYNNTVNSCDTSVANNNVQVKANAEMTTRSAQTALSDNDEVNKLNQESVAMSRYVSVMTVNESNDAKIQSTALSGVSSVIGSAASGAVTGAAMGTVAFPGGGTAAGAIVGGITGLAGAITNGVNTSISVNASETNANFNNIGNQTNVNNSNETATKRTKLATNNSKNNMTTQNSASNAIVLNTSTTAKQNAANSKNTADAGIVAQVNQAATRAPFSRGVATAGNTATTRPMAYFLNVVTQSMSAIEQTGDIFLRYGYALNRQWKVTSLNVMKHFTYWKCSEVWCVGGSDNMLFDAENAIKNILMDGVTVWSNPDEIGRVSIYDN